MSNWALPTQVSQYAETDFEETHVSWLEVDNFSGLKNKDNRSIRTSRDLVHIARDPKHDIVEKTYYLRATGFNFLNLPDQISGIEVKLSMNRFGRITDDTVQLCLNNNTVGENLADLDLAPNKVYGSETNLWETNLTLENITDPSFGVVLRFQSHPHWPHKVAALIDSIEIRVH